MWYSGKKATDLHPSHLGAGRVGAKDTARDVLKYATSLFLSGSPAPGFRLQVVCYQPSTGETLSELLVSRGVSAGAEKRTQC